MDPPANTGRKLAEGGQGASAGAGHLAPAGIDWLLNVLTVSGPAGKVARFRDAARGSGGIPRHLELDHEQARMLARQLCEIIAARHDRLLARWREPGHGPFDLHRLIPITDAVLPRRG